MTIKEIEAATGLPRANVRYYESLGLIHPARGANGYRDYQPEDVETLLKIKLLRQLDCSLEDIQALERGERTLEQVLDQIWSALEQKQAQTQRAGALCQQMQADRPSWDSLQPERYLFWSPAPAAELPPVADAADDLGNRCPWRRYFARNLDYSLCLLIWTLIQALVFRANVLAFSTAQEMLNTFVALVLLLLLEPLFLHFLGTTPGKALFDLRLTRSDGSFLSLGEGYRRTALVLVAGLGLMIPFISLATLIFSYLRCRRREPMVWEGWDEVWSDSTNGTLTFWELKSGPARAAGYIGCYVATVALVLLACLAAAAPRHQGALTTQEFVSNYNHLLTFASAPAPPGETLNENGTWSQTDPNSVVIYAMGVESPPFRFTQEDGRLTQVSFSVSAPEHGGMCSVPSGYATRTLHALLGERELLPGKALSAIDQELSQPVTGKRTWSLEGWDITCTLDFSGYDLYQNMLIPAEGQAQELTYFFSAQFTGSPA